MTHPSSTLLFAEKIFYMVISILKLNYISTSKPVVYSSDARLLHYIFQQAIATPYTPQNSLYLLGP